MKPTVLVTDTHPLMWYATAKFGKLSRRVRSAFDEAVEGNIAIWVPTAVLWEMSLLIKAGKVRSAVALDDYVAEHFFARAIHLLDMVPEDVVRAHSLNFSPDPWDSIIVATALRMGCALITTDAVIHDCRPCEVYWD